MTIKDRGLGFSREVLIIDEFPQVVLELDPNRQDLAIFNLSDTEILYIALGTRDYPELLESGRYSKEMAIPLFPGEAWEPSVVPYNDITLFLDVGATNVIVTVAYTTLLPELVKGEARPDV